MEREQNPEMDPDVDPLLMDLFSEVVRLQDLIHDFRGTPKDQRLYTTGNALNAIYHNTGMTPKRQLESNRDFYRDFLKGYDLKVG